MTIQFIIAGDVVPPNPTEGMSPNARSFHRYGEIPVSLYTGTPSIKIPLVTFQENKLTLPISLSYHSGGIKVEDHPGSTGLGWTLFAGGAITRVVKDTPDELDQIGFFYKYSAINGLDKRPQKLDSILATYNQSDFFNFDLQPDKFSFQFLDYSGYFIMDSKGEWHVYCERPLKVESYTLKKPEYLNPEIFPAHNSKIISTIILVGEDGTKYTFGDDAIDLSINFLRQNSAAWEANAWHIKKIEHPNGEVIAYNYFRGQFLANFTNTIQWAYLSNNGVVEAVSLPKDKQGRLISPVYLSNVRSATYRAEMSYSPSVELDYTRDDYDVRLRVDFDDPAARPIYFTEGQYEKVKWYKLDKIDLYCNDILFRKIEFEYTSNPNIRLMLKAVKYNGVSDDTYEQYKFKYHKPEKMPSYLSNQTDHWGYYNGITNNKDSIAETKLADTICTRYGSLYEITYPTGGKTVFEYEAHSYSRVANSVTSGDLCEVKDTTAGGLRIRKIYDIPNDSSTVRVKEFKYIRNYNSHTSNASSSGILECPPEYQLITPCIGGRLIIEGADSPLSNIVNGFGNYIGYQEVVELTPDGGYVVHKFSSCADLGYKDEPPLRQSTQSKFIPLTSRAQYRGMPLFEEVYNTFGKLVRTKEYRYDIFDSEKDYVHSFYFQTNPLSPLNAHQYGIAYQKYSLYKKYTQALKITAIIERLYDGTNDKPLEICKYTKYNTIGQLKCDSMVIKQKGRARFRYTIHEYQWEKNKEFSNKHLLSYPFSAITYENGKQLFAINTEYSFIGQVPYISTIYKKNINNNLQTLYTCIYADNRGNPLLIRTADGLLIGYIWGVDRIHPVASITMLDESTYHKMQNMNIQVSEDMEDLNAMFAQLRTALPEAMVTGYIYTPWCGVTRIIDPSGKEQSYHYDEYGRLVEICDKDGNIITKYDYSTATENIKHAN